MKEIKPEIKETPHFQTGSSRLSEDGSRQLNPIEPYIISGGRVTERCYFSHLTNCTNYKFTILPRYFGNEASFAEVFPKHVDDILSGNPDAKDILCV